LRKLIEFDDDTFEKHGIPVDLKDALRKSAAGATTTEPQQPRRKSSKRSSTAKKKS
jgi:hypothetical protein